MKTTMRIGFVTVAAAVLMACGGASSDPLEQVSGGTSRLDGTGDDKGDSTKDPNDCTKPGDPDPGTKDPGTCFGAYEGGGTSCKPASDWKLYASDVCSAKGASLTGLYFGAECGKDSYSEVKFECCMGTASPPDPKEPPKDPGPGTGDPSSCIGEYQDGACQSEADWKNGAIATCAKLGLSLGDIGYGSVCGTKGEIGEVKFTCCK